MRLLLIKYFVLLWSLSLMGSHASAAEKKARQKIISAEKVVKSKKGARSTSIDFDSVDISGERKMPLGSTVMQTRGYKDGSLIKVRHDWHNEMIQSASSL